MKEDVLIVDYDPFAHESRTSVLKDGKRSQMRVSSDLAGLAEVLIGLAYSHDIYNVKIHAPYAITNKIIEQVAEREKLIYSNSKIKVEGI